jgi:hypothetical protein
VPCHKGSAGVLREFWGKVEEKQEKRNKKKSQKYMLSIIFKNNTMISILAIELLNTILLLIF